MPRKKGPNGPMSDRLRRMSTPSPSGCWLWDGTLNNHGYGQMTVPGRRTRSAHRVSYETFVGPIPDGLVIDHICRTRHCVNPKHLRTVTQRENVMASPVAIGALNAAKTHCPSGHPYNEANTYVYVKPNTVCRVCRTCHRESKQRSRARRAAMAVAA